MKLNWNLLLLSAMFAALIFFGAGCGGLNSGASVSPASFFLPGLLRNDTTTNAPAASPDLTRELASSK
ncbi:MAG TPA: hypothetical protein VMH30_05040 [Verrucomicrobiae bacterium]|nr:hypothetical protein [Verrucomicrobiae bacterium]